MNRSKFKSLAAAVAIMLGGTFFNINYADASQNNKVTLENRVEEESNEVERPLKYVNELIVNTLNEDRTAMKGSENEGIKYMEKLVTGKLEEAWIYLPKKSLFIEIGRDEEEAGASIDQDYLINKIKENDELVFYHIHPGLKKILPSPSDIYYMNILYDLPLREVL